MSAEQHYGGHNQIDPFNPPKKPKEDDWWDKLCKQHGAKNHWEKKEAKKESKNTSQTKKTKVKKLKNKINKKLK